jgi:lipopolysaccharide transport system permease protein
MVVFTVIFGSIAKLDSQGLPYGFIVFAGVLPWYLFASTLSETSNCLLANTGLLTKVYFPRLIFPTTIFVTCLVDFSVSFILLLCMMAWYHLPLSWEIFYLPIFVIAPSFFALGLGMMMATLNVRYRDFQQLIPFILQLGIYISPVGYLNQTVPTHLEVLYSLNPMAGIINGFRWCLMPSALTPYWPGIVFSCISSILILYIGIKVFRSAEARFADTI